MALKGDMCIKSTSKPAALAAFWKTTRACVMTMRAVFCEGHYISPTWRTGQFSKMASEGNPSEVAEASTRLIQAIETALNPSTVQQQRIEAYQVQLEPFKFKNAIEFKPLAICYNVLHARMKTTSCITVINIISNFLLACISSLLSSSRPVLHCVFLWHLCCMTGKMLLWSAIQVFSSWNILSSNAAYSDIVYNLVYLYAY